MSKNNILATVGNREITQSKLDFLLKNLDPRTAQQFGSEEGRKNLLQELINQELFYLHAIDNDLDKDEQFISEMDKIKEDFLKQFSVGRLLKGVTVSEDEVAAFYNECRSQFVSPESVKASHILVDSEDKAFEILDEINDGLSFEEAAQKHSSCPSKSVGGDLGYFSEGMMVPEFEEAAFNMENNEISKPVKTQFGYHIIKVIDKKAPSEKSIDEVRSQLTKQMISQKQQELYLMKVDELKGKYEVKVNI